MNPKELIPDPLPQDIANHGVYGALASALGACASLFVFGLVVTVPHQAALALAAAVAVAAAYGVSKWKESVDKSEGRAEDPADVKAGLFGGAIVAAPLLAAALLLQ